MGGTAFGEISMTPEGNSGVLVDDTTPDIDVRTVEDLPLAIDLRVADVTPPCPAKYGTLASR